MAAGDLSVRATREQLQQHVSRLESLLLPLDEQVGFSKSNASHIVLVRLLAWRALPA
jgi:hypothetical protein